MLGMTIPPQDIVMSVIGGQPVAITRSRRPHSESDRTPSEVRKCVESVSLGNVALSTTSTLWPCRASSMPVGEPAQRAPTMIASYMERASCGSLNVFSERRFRLYHIGNAGCGEVHVSPSPRPS